jgi:hypothetical protein
MILTHRNVFSDLSARSLIRSDAGHRKGRPTRSESSEKTQSLSPLGRVGGRQQALEMSRIAPESTCRLASYPTRPRGDPYGSVSSRFGIRYSRDDPGIVSRFLPLTEDCQVWIYTAQCAL